MQTNQPLTFGSYRFAPHTGQLRRGKQEVRLTGKASAVLYHLVARAGQVVTKTELFTALWLDTVVSDAALTSCIRELRQALHDNARKPRFIETVHRRGFRFLPTVTTAPVEREAWSVKRAGRSSASVAPRSTLSALRVVGRDSDLAFLRERLAKAVNGERQIVFVTGEPGIGKTTVVEAFLFGVRGPGSHEENQKAKIKNQNLPIPDPCPLSPKSGGSSALSTTGQGKRICPSWKPWGACVGRQRVSTSSNCYPSTPPRGWCKCQRC